MISRILFVAAVAAISSCLPTAEAQEIADAGPAPSTDAGVNDKDASAKDDDKVKSLDELNKGLDEIKSELAGDE